MNLKRHYWPKKGSCIRNDCFRSVSLAMRIGLFIIFFLSLKGFAQFQKTDSLGNFYVIEHQLVWQKWYALQDKDELNQQLKSNSFTSGLDILKFTNSTKTRPSRLNGDNLPEYARHGYESFLYLDIIGGRYRITIKQIIFLSLFPPWVSDCNK